LWVLHRYGFLDTKFIDYIISYSYELCFILLPIIYDINNINQLVFLVMIGNFQLFHSAYNLKRILFALIVYKSNNI